MISIILVMIGGGFGAIARSAITDYFNHKFTSKLPIATLIVNLVGSFFNWINYRPINFNLMVPCVLCHRFFRWLNNFLNVSQGTYINDDTKI